jgi:hypothetical protein
MVNADLDVKFLVLLGPPHDVLGFLEHLNGHLEETVHLVLALDLGLDLLFVRFDSCCCHVCLAHCLDLLHGIIMTKLIK